MNVLKKLENMQGSKPYLGFAKLAIGNHKIMCLRIVKNKFAKKGEGNGKSIIVELSDQILFLPQHFAQNLGSSDIEELNASKEAVFLHFGGQQDGSK